MVLAKEASQHPYCGGPAVPWSPGRGQTKDTGEKAIPEAAALREEEWRFSTKRHLENPKRVSGSLVASWLTLTSFTS